MNKIIIYLTKDKTLFESFYLPPGLTHSYIIQKINETFDTWYYYDILEK
jgi:hypothetical protein